MSIARTRRAFLISTTAASGGLLLGCKSGEAAEQGHAANAAATRKEGGPSDEAQEVTAVEDLMREHGVIRRALVVYREAAQRLRTKAGDVPADALQKTARLLRSFGEDYHEKKLEEVHIFPAVKRAGGVAAGYVDVLIAQHDRGREINDWIVARAGASRTLTDIEMIAQALEAFARMYEEHAALEDTVVFPAWKKTMSAKRLHEMGELFEDIEHKTFGKDGFDDAVEQITAIVRAFRLELAQFTPPPPPSR
jgi:hemerythrin-like domain-containing protein